MRLSDNPAAGVELSTTGVSHALGISVTRVRQLAAEGRLEWRETPLGRLYSISSVEQLLEQRAQR